MLYHTSFINKFIGCTEYTIKGLIITVTLVAHVSNDYSDVRKYLKVLSGDRDWGLLIAHPTRPVE